MNFKEVLDRFCSLFQKKEGSRFSGKGLNKYNGLILVGAFGVLLIILSNSFERAKPEVKILAEEEITSPTEKEEASSLELGTDIVSTENQIAQRLEGILSQISGAGNVKATVNLASTMEYEYAVNTSTNNKTTEERDQKGGNRRVTELNEDGQLVLVRKGEGSKELPVVRKEIKPQVQGVVVVAEGAENPEIKAQLMEAVQVYLNVAPHRVVVLPKESR